jgi:hypothetical protein
LLASLILFAMVSFWEIPMLPPNNCVTSELMSEQLPAWPGGRWWCYFLVSLCDTRGMTDGWMVILEDLQILTFTYEYIGRYTQNNR